LALPGAGCKSQARLACGRNRLPECRPADRCHGADGRIAAGRLGANSEFDQLFRGGSDPGGEEAQKLRDRARRTIYEIAARECDILREVLAKECRIVSVSSNMSRQYGQQQPEGFTINGSMNFQITLK
jgi:hypothetical protein